MKQLVSYFFLYFLSNLFVPGDSEGKRGRGFTRNSTNLNLTKTSRNISEDAQRKLPALLFIDELRSKGQSGDGELTESDRDSISKFNFDNLRIFPNQKDPHQKPINNEKDWDTNINKLSDFLDEDGRQKMWLVTEIERQDLSRYLQLLKNSLFDKKKLQFISSGGQTAAFTRCTDQSQCSIDQICHNGTFCTTSCQKSSECEPDLLCHLGVCILPGGFNEEVQTDQQQDPSVTCTEDVECPVQFVCNARNTCERSVGTLSAVACSESSSCPGPEVCVSGLCERTCAVQGDCQAGTVCHETLHVCHPSPRAQPCSHHSQCGTSGLCLNRSCHQRCGEAERCPPNTVCNTDLKVCTGDLSHHLDTAAVHTIVNSLIQKIENITSEEIVEESLDRIDTENRSQTDTSQHNENQLDPNIVGFKINDGDRKQVIVECGTNCQDFKKPGEKLFLDDYRLVFPVTVPTAIQNTPNAVETIPTIPAAKAIPTLTETAPAITELATTIPTVPTALAGVSPSISTETVVAQTIPSVPKVTLTDINPPKNISSPQTPDNNIKLEDRTLIDNLLREDFI